MNLECPSIKIREPATCSLRRFEEGRVQTLNPLMPKSHHLPGWRGAGHAAIHLAKKFKQLKITLWDAWHGFGCQLRFKVSVRVCVQLRSRVPTKLWSPSENIYIYIFSSCYLGCADVRWSMGFRFFQGLACRCCLSCSYFMAVAPVGSKLPLSLSC